MKKRRKTNLLRETSRGLPSREEVDWFRSRILEWAKENGRDFPWRHTNDEYRIVVTEILLQQTTATAVAEIYEQFFDALPSWQSLHEVSEEELIGKIRRLGLYRQRTKRLKALAAWVAAHEWQLPRTRGELEEIPGIGQYVASALLAIKYDEPEPMLDVNMARVLERYFGERELADLRDDPWLQTLSRMIVKDAETSWALLDFAAAVCRAREPECPKCPLRNKFCQSNHNAGGTM